jgi:hypothetical protein
MRDLLTEDGIIPHKARANGHAVETPTGPVGDVDAELAAMRPGDGSVNERQTRVITSLIMRAENPNDIVARVVEGTMKIAPPDWTERKEYDAVSARVKTQLGFIYRDYDYRTGEIPTWLCPDFHKAWIEALNAGKRPEISRNIHGFYVRGFDVRSDPQDKKPEQEAEPPRARKSRFRIVRFSDLKIGEGSPHRRSLSRAFRCSTSCCTWRRVGSIAGGA